MFESLVAGILNRVLGSYIENFDSNQLNIGIWSGDVKLKNLRLKKESLDELKLPINVKFGHIGELSLSIPWSNLKGKPVKIVVEDVYLLAYPILPDEYDPEEQAQRDFQLKLNKLKELEAIELAKIQGDQLQPHNPNASDDASNQTFAESLITKIIDNLQLTIRNIHIRYEDDAVLTESPYSVGVTLKELSAVSTDEAWEPSFISITQPFTRKLMTLNSLTCYMNTNSEPLDNETVGSLLAEFQAQLDDSAINRYLLQPVLGSGRLKIHKAGATDSTPHIESDIFFQKFAIDLHSQQYHDLLWTASKFHWFIKTRRFKKGRPKVAPKDDPKAWFKYAAKTILDEIHERNYKWTWEYFAERRDARIRYLALWKKHLSQGDKSLTPEEQSELEKLHFDLTYEDIRFYRSLVRTELKKEKVELALISSKKEPENKGWFSSWWSGDNKTDPTENSTTDAGDDDEPIDMSLSDEQRKALYDTIDFDDTKDFSTSIDIPRERVLIQVNATLESGGFSIKSDKFEGNLAEIAYEGCKAQFFQRSDSFFTNFQLQEFRVEDGTNTSIYKHIVSVKHLHSNFHEDNSQSSSGSDNVPFFQVAFENNPLDGLSDSVLVGKLRSMTIFNNGEFVKEVISFFKPPKVHLDTIGAIMNAAEASLEGITQQTRIGLQYALDEHKTINVKLDLQAPLIIVPLDPQSYKSPVAILDAGHISVVSNLADKQKIEEIKEKETYSENDWNQLSDLMYDKFTVELKDSQFLVGTDLKSTMEQLHGAVDSTISDDGGPDETISALILDKFNMSFKLGISIMPEAYHLPKFKVGGDVPMVNLSINDFQYKTIMNILDILVPQFSDSESESSSVFEAYGAVIDQDPNNEHLLHDLETDSLERSTLVASAPLTSKSQIPEAAKEQHVFEFDFKVEMIKVCLRRCIDGTTLKSERFIDLVGSSLNLHFYKTEDNMHLELVLQDIDLYDHIESSGIPEFEKLISSNNFTPEENRIKSKDLFLLKYDRVLRMVEFKGEMIELFDQFVDIDIATVKFVLTRKSILSILNFALNTFTDPYAEPTPADALIHNDSSNEAIAPQKIQVNLKLDSIILVLNEDGLKLATLELSTAAIDILLWPLEMEVNGKLGGLTLHDEINEGSPRDSSIRKLITMEGENLAEFMYKTFDPQTNKNLYNSIVKFTSGPPTINLVEDSYNRIINFMTLFLKMKEIYDTTRDDAINLGTNLNDAAKMKFDVTVNSPRIIWPKLTTFSTKKQYDSVTTYLGEFFAYNDYKEEKENQNLVINKINVGLRNATLDSTIHFDQITQSLSILDGMDVIFGINYVDKYDSEIPTFSISGKLPEVDMHLTELQLQYLKEMNDSIIRIFTFDEHQELEDVKLDAIHANAVMRHTADLKNPRSRRRSSIASLVLSETGDPEIPIDHSLVDFTFEIPQVSLTIYNNTHNVEDFRDKKLSLFALKNSRVKFVMKQDTHFVCDIEVEAFVVEDVRVNCSNRFKEIIPPIENDKQFVLSASSDGKPDKKNVVVVLDIKNPKTILALDYMLELQLFVNKGLESKRPLISDEDLDDLDDEKEEKNNFANVASNNEGSDDSGMTFGFSINLKEPSITLLADGSKPDTEAIVFKVEQVLLTSQHVFSLAANNIGMFLCQMDDEANKNYRIIDNFSISFAQDARGSDATHYLTSIEASVDPILVRVSLRDIRLATNIFNRANELYNKMHAKVGTTTEEASFSKEFQKAVSYYAPSILSNRSRLSHKAIITQAEEGAIVKGEELNVSLGGARFVLLGDVHDMPVLDFKTNPFDVKARNWSTDLYAETTFESYINIYNYARSCWEPLVEPWPVSIYASKKTGSKECLLIDIIAREMAQVTVYSRSVGLLSQIFSRMSSDIELKPRGEDSPYRIVNQTGLDIKVWLSLEEAESDEGKLIKTGETVPWAFESWTKVRQNLDVDSNAIAIGVTFCGALYDDLTQVLLNGEGTEVYMLEPAMNKIHNRLLCDITLGEDNVKTVVLRSTVKIQNDSDTGIHILLLDESHSENNAELLIPSGGSYAVPINSVYYSRLSVRPNISTSYNWSKEKLFWHDITKDSTTLSCGSFSTNDNSFYYYHAVAHIAEDEPLATIYPFMTVTISAPVEIDNFLPYDLEYRLYDKNNEREWKGKLSKGMKNYVHVVSLRSLLLLSVQAVGTPFKKSEFAIINSPRGYKFPRENKLPMRGPRDLTLTLKIHYPPRSKTNAGSKAVLYAPYVILNRTGKELTIKDGNNLIVCPPSEREHFTPYMFSFIDEENKSNRALLRVEDSSWTSPISFDAIGQSSAASAQMLGRQMEYNIGVHVAEGEGKYNLSKVVTFTPRYVVRNLLDEDIEVIESGSTQRFQVNSKAIAPLYGLRRTREKNIMIKFAHSSKTWTAPFSINEVGQIFVKINKSSSQILVKVNLLIEDATLFIQMEEANDEWPFSIRNFTDHEYYIYQLNPNLNSEGEQVRNDYYKPVYYKIPPKSVMPYAYDYPSAIVKEIIVRARGRERAVNLAEIGNQKPFRLPPTDNSEQAIIDLNVIADGPSQCLVISNYDPSLSLYKLKKQSSSAVEVDKTESLENDDFYYTKILCKFEGVSFSLLNTRMQELAYITTRGIELRYNESDIYQNLSAKVKWIQIDNQLTGCVFPIVLYPTVVPKSNSEMSSHPTLLASVVKVKDETHGVVFIKYATILLQELTLEIDEDFLFAFLDFTKFPGASWNHRLQDKLCDENTELPVPLKSLNDSDIYFETLHLQPMSLNLSFVRTERINAEEEKGSNGNTLTFFFNMLTMAIGNVNDAPIRLNSLYIENIRVPVPVLIETILTQYGQDFFYQVHKILGSADFLGNPVGLFNQISSGFLDIFYEPYNGFIITDRPQEIGIGLAKGGASFVKKSVFGVSDSVAKVTGSIAKGLTVATMDKKFQERRRRMVQNRNRPRNALYNFSTGATSFFDSVTSGVSGIATAPIEGANKDGAAGFFKGLGKGIVGLPTKTAIGIFDFASNMSEGIRNSTTMFEASEIDRVRLPRYISYDRVIRPYSEREALGQNWLNQLDEGIYFKEKYLAHLLLTGEEKAVIVTFRKIILLQVNTMKSIWVIPYNQVKTITIESTGIQIDLKDRSGPFIPVPERGGRQFLYNRMSVAVTEYNNKCQVAL